MHISFDFDYTLADSSGGAIACANYALRELGMQEAEAALIKRTIGLNLVKTFEFLGGGDSTSVEASQFKQLFLSHADRVMLDHIHIYPGTVDSLNMLKKNGHLISIVSTKRKEHIEEAIERDGLTDLIDVVIGGGCVKKNKPHPEGLNRAIEELEMSADESLYAGDSAADGECAYRAGVRFIGLLSGTTNHSELLKWDPVCILQGIDEIPGFVSSIRQ